MPLRTYVVTLDPSRAASLDVEAAGAPSRYSPTSSIASAEGRSPASTATSPRRGAGARVRRGGRAQDGRHQRRSDVRHLARRGPPPSALGREGGDHRREPCERQVVRRRRVELEGPVGARSPRSPRWAAASEGPRPERVRHGCSRAGVLDGGRASVASSATTPSTSCAASGSRVDERRGGARRRPRRLGGRPGAGHESRGVVTLTWDVDDWAGVDVVGGAPQLLANGRVVANDNCGTYFCLRNPRAGVGYTEDGRILLVVVDGRSSSSIGVTPSASRTSSRTSAPTSALNLDGGGGATMWVKGKGVVNVPSDGSERVVSNAVLVLPIRPGRADRAVAHSDAVGVADRSRRRGGSRARRSGLHGRAAGPLRRLSLPPPRRAGRRGGGGACGACPRLIAASPSTGAPTAVLPHDDRARARGHRGAGHRASSRRGSRRAGRG